MDQVKIWNSFFKDNIEDIYFSPNYPVTYAMQFLDSSSTVLDIGIGNGVNSIQLLKAGIKVVGIDIVKTETMSKAEHMFPNLDFQLTDAFNMKLSSKFDLIIVSNVIQFYPKSKVYIYLSSLVQNLNETGLIYISTFDISDTNFKMAKKRGSEIEKNSFYNAKYESYYSFYNFKELKKCFKDTLTLYQSKSKIADFSHGSFHYHSIIDLLIKI